MADCLRLAALTACLMSLSGCNNVVSNEPWFTAADTEGAPELRDGLWVMITDAPCRVKLEKPAERWPDCADPFYVRGGEWLAMQWDETGRSKRIFERWESVPMLLARGDPAIFQFDQGIERPAPAADPDEIVLEDSEPHWRYTYAAMRPTERDTQGRTVAIEFWTIQCGPLTAREFEGGVEYPLLSLMEGYVTERPFPGLMVVGQDCTAESVDALRQAAASSRSLGEPAPVRWLRDGWH